MRGDGDTLDLFAKLDADAEDIALRLLGEPTKASRNQRWWGKRQSLNLVITGPKRGAWHDRESSEGGRMFGLIRRECGGDTRAAFEWAEKWLNLDDTQRRIAAKPAPANDAQAKREVEAEDAEAIGYARRIWSKVEPVTPDTVAGRYLLGRAIAAPYPAALGFRRDRYGKPEMVIAGTTSDGVVTAVQVCFLTDDGKKRLYRSRPRLTHGRPQPTGAFGRLDGSPDALVLAEGPETGLSAWSATGLETRLAFGSLGRFRDVDLPTDRPVIICRDAHAPEAPATKTLNRLVEALLARGVDVRVTDTPHRREGYDLNDVHQDDGAKVVRDLVLNAPRPEGGPRPPSLGPYFAGPTEGRDFAKHRQDKAIREWFTRASAAASANKDVVERRNQALADQGFLDPRHASQRVQAGATRAATVEVLAETGLSRADLRHGVRMMVTGAQGSGKTRAVLEGVAGLADDRLTVGLYVPTLDKADEALRDYRTKYRAPDSPPAMVVRGRAAPVPGSARETMCQRHEVATKVAALGGKVDDLLCQKCPFRDGCAYLAQRGQIRDQGAGLFVMSHEYLFVPSSDAMASPDLVAVDEDVTLKAASDVSFAPARIADSGKWQGSGINAALAYRSLAGKLQAAVVDNPGRELAFLRGAGVTLDDLKSAREYINSAASSEIRGVDGSMTDAEILQALARVEATELGQVRHLVAQIIREWDTGRDGLHSVRYEPDHKVKVTAEDGTETTEVQPRVVVSYLRSLQKIGARTAVLLTDGTGAPDLARLLWGDRLDHLHVPFPRDARVVQVAGSTEVRAGMFSRQSITGLSSRGEPIGDSVTKRASEKRADILSFVQAVKGRRTFVAMTKGAEDVLGPDLVGLGGVEVGHFGALRGINAWEGCDVAVVVGREQPSALALENQLRAFLAGDKVSFQFGAGYALQCRARRMRDESFEPVAVEVHPDPRAQLLLEQIREAELVQAIDRVRSIFNRRTVYVLWSGVADLTVDAVRSWSDLKSGGTRLERAAARGLVPLTPSGLHAAHPDLWASEKAAARWLENERRPVSANTPESPIDILLGKWGSLQIVEYRRVSSKRWARAAFDPARFPDPASALSEVFGESVEVRGWPPPVEDDGDREPLPDIEPSIVTARATAFVGENAWMSGGVVSWSRDMRKSGRVVVGIRGSPGLAVS